MPVRYTHVPQLSHACNCSRPYPCHTACTTCPRAGKGRRAVLPKVQGGLQRRGARVLEDLHLRRLALDRRRREQGVCTRHGWCVCHLGLDRGQARRAHNRASNGIVVPHIALHQAALVTPWGYTMEHERQCAIARGVHTVPQPPANAVSVEPTPWGGHDWVLAVLKVGRTTVLHYS